MKQREAEKLKALRESLAKQRANLDEIEKHIDQIEEESKRGGEEVVVVENFLRRTFLWWQGDFCLHFLD